MAENGGNIYRDKRINENSFIRYFSKDIDENQLVWHQDKKDRNIKIIQSEEWYLQYDNQLPILLRENETYFIKSNTYHRILKGKNDLIIEIIEE